MRSGLTLMLGFVVMGCAVPVASEQDKAAEETVEILIHQRCRRAVQVVFSPRDGSPEVEVDLPDDGDVVAAVPTYSVARVIDPAAWTHTRAFIEDDPDTRLVLEHYELGSWACVPHVILNDRYVIRNRW